MSDRSTRLPSGIREQVLRHARDVYGNKNQILVCMEELNELACVLAKYPRFTEESDAIQQLYDKALDEVADVSIILEHVKAIFGITNGDLDTRIDKKITRLSRWLHNSTSMQETIDDRVVDVNCSGCAWDGTEDSGVYETYCAPCLKAQATEGTTPYKYMIGEDK